MYHCKVDGQKPAPPGMYEILSDRLKKSYKSICIYSIIRIVMSTGNLQWIGPNLLVVLLQASFFSTFPNTKTVSPKDLHMHLRLLRLLSDMSTRWNQHIQTTPVILCGFENGFQTALPYLTRHQILGKRTTFILGSLHSSLPNVSSHDFAKAQEEFPPRVQGHTPTQPSLTGARQAPWPGIGSGLGASYPKFSHGIKMVDLPCFTLRGGQCQLFPS